VLSWDDASGPGATGGVTPADTAASNPDLPIDESDLASIIFTSGSTGAPKGVMLTHGNVAANTAAICRYLELTSADRQMVVLPFHYVMGKSLLNTHFAVGGSVVLNNRFAYPVEVLRQMEVERVTGFSGVPSTYAYLLHRSPLRAYRDRLPSLRYCSQAGGHLAPHLKEEVLRVLPGQTRFFVMYGATEASARLTYLPPELLPRKLDSIGRPIDGVEMRVVDEAGRELAAGETGELVASGPNIMAGYWQDPEATAAALGPLGYRTGDLGYRDPEGDFFLTGRKDEQLKIGGHRVNPREIEDALLATGLLVQVAVIGLPDPLLGQRLAALAVPVEREAGAAEILRRGAERLPRSRLPAEIRLVARLPQSASGKIDRERCRELLQESRAE
jgi:acyl-CoA synthetase (AMP-forming)/AMP-acid ligase II